MSEDYLWDRQGEPDQQVARLETLLAPLAFEELPLITVSAASEAPRPEPRVVRPRRWWPTAVTAAAAVAAALLIWWWGFAAGRDRPAQIVVERVPVAAPPPPIVVGPAAESESESEPEPEPESESESESESRPRSRATKKSSKSSSGLPDPAGSKSSPKTDDGGGEIDVDCILDPAKCGKGSPPKGPHGSLDPNVPEKLSTSDIKAGIAPVKPLARACGPKHGAAPGTKVKIKLSISGATGTVTSSVAQSPHSGTPLGNCVAAAAKQAKFKTFRKPSLGAVYPFRVTSGTP